LIKEQDLIEAIAECQGDRNPNAATCRNLAAFYTILDHIQQRPNDVQKVSPIERLNYSGDTEFAEAIRGKPFDAVIPIIDELMNTVQIINPRLYASVINKINGGG
jgi:hypothetical protein